MKTVVMISFWRDDVEKQLEARVAHLLGKSFPYLRWVWVVGDSSDDTETRLRGLAEGRPVTVIRHDTHIVGEQPGIRLLRLSHTAQAALAQVTDQDLAVLIHESDLQSGPDVIERLLSVGVGGVGGWPVLQRDGQELFYDTWAYRAGGRMFSNHPPYHPVYRPDRPFEVESVGSVWLFPAIDAPHIMPDRLACVEMCAKLRQRGRIIRVEPTVRIVQPTDLWVHREHFI